MGSLFLLYFGKEQNFMFVTVEFWSIVQAVCLSFGLGVAVGVGLIVFVSLRFAKKKGETK